MDKQSRDALFALLTSQRIASLGTLRESAPLVTMVQYAPAADFSAFYIHISRLAQHTENIRRDPRVSLMIVATGAEQQDPQTLARISIIGTADQVNRRDEAYEETKALYLGNNPGARRNFMLSDFELYAIRPQSARFIAGFGRIFDLSPEELRVSD